MRALAEPVASGPGSVALIQWPAVFAGAVAAAGGNAASAPSLAGENIFAAKLTPDVLGYMGFSRKF
jgi:hypothetical protein